MGIIHVRWNSANANSKEFQYLFGAEPRKIHGHQSNSKNVQLEHCTTIMEYSILALGGDGIGPEVLACGITVAQTVADASDIDLEIAHDLLHGECWDIHGTFCRDETVEAACNADAVLVGAIGGPCWDHIKVDGGAEMQDGLMRLRKEMNAYAGLRPARFWPSLAHQTPFAQGRAERADILIIREMSGGILFAEPRGMQVRDGKRYAFDTAAYDESEVRRIAITGFELARSRRKQLVSTDKANVMESFKLWREVVSEVAAAYPDVSLRHLYADNLAYQMIMQPSDFDVVVCCNLLGDLLSDLAAVVSGALGMLPSACLCGEPRYPVKGIYEPVHGSAPDIAGTGTANPVGMILSVAMMLEYSFGRPDLAVNIENSVSAVIESGIRTRDIGGTADTVSFTEAVIAELSA